MVGSLAINPNTVLKAYRELEHRGLAAGRLEQGTFVQGWPCCLAWPPSGWPAAGRPEVARLFSQVLAWPESFGVACDGRYVGVMACSAGLASLPTSAHAVPLLGS